MNSIALRPRQGLPHARKLSRLLYLQYDRRGKTRLDAFRPFGRRSTTRETATAPRLLLRDGGVESHFVSTRAKRRAVRGLLTSGQDDRDQDGLSDDLEVSLGTDPRKADTDEDGFSDKNEVENGYNPLGQGTQPISVSFSSESRKSL